MSTRKRKYATKPGVDAFGNRWAKPKASTGPRCGATFTIQGTGESDHCGKPPGHRFDCGLADPPKSREVLTLERQLRKVTEQWHKEAEQFSKTLLVSADARERAERQCQEAEDRVAKLLAERHAFTLDPDLEKTKRFVTWAREHGVTAFECPLGKFNVIPTSSTPDEPLAAGRGGLGRQPPEAVSDEDAFGASG